MQYEDTHIYFHTFINQKKFAKLYFNSCNRNLKEIYKIPLNYLFEKIYFCLVLLFEHINQCIVSFTLLSFMFFFDEKEF